MPARRLAAAIPTASMADVAFLLLLFFLITGALRSDLGLPVTLPARDATGTASEPAVLTVLVDAEGAVLLDGDAADPEAVRAGVAAFAAEAGEPYVVLQAHRRTPYDAYVDALDAVLMGHRDAGTTPRLTLREPVADA